MTVTWWMILLIIAGVILFIILIGFIYACVIAKKDGTTADPNETKIAFGTQEAAKILMKLKEEERSMICRVTRGIEGVRIEIASSGEPPVHYDKEIILETRPEEQQRQLCRHTADMIVHFTNGQFVPVQEYGDSYRIEKNLYYVPPTIPGQEGRII